MLGLTIVKDGVRERLHIEAHNQSTSAIMSLGVQASFSPIPVEEHEDAWPEGTPLSFKRGEILFAQDEPASAIWIVRSGLLKVTSVETNGVEAVIGLVGPGQILGGLEALTGARHSFAAVALSSCEVCRVSADAARGSVSQIPPKVLSVLKTSVIQLGWLTTQVRQQKALSSVQRLAVFLLEAGTQDNSVTLAYDKELLAAVLGMTPSTLSRCFQQLKGYGVRVSGRSIEIADTRELGLLLLHDTKTRHSQNEA